MILFICIIYSYLLIHIYYFCFTHFQAEVHDVQRNQRFLPLSIRIEKIGCLQLLAVKAVGQRGQEYPLVQHPLLEDIWNATVAFNIELDDDDFKISENFPEALVPRWVWASSSGTVCSSPTAPSGSVSASSICSSDAWLSSLTSAMISGSALDFRSSHAASPSRPSLSEVSFFTALIHNCFLGEMLDLVN